MHHGLRRSANGATVSLFVSAWRWFCFYSACIASYCQASANQAITLHKMGLVTVECEAVRGISIFRARMANTRQGKPDDIG